MNPIAPGTFNARDKSPLESDQIGTKHHSRPQTKMGLEISITTVAGVIKTQ